MTYLATVKNMLTLPHFQARLYSGSYHIANSYTCKKGVGSPRDYCHATSPLLQVSHRRIWHGQNILHPKLLQTNQYVNLYSYIIGYLLLLLLLQIPEFIVCSAPYTVGELKVVAKGGALLAGRTVQPLKTKQSGFSSKCSFTGLTLGPPGQYVLEVVSTSDPAVVLRSHPIIVAPPPLKKSELGQVFDDLDKMFQFWCKWLCICWV